MNHLSGGLVAIARAIDERRNSPCEIGDVLEQSPSLERGSFVREKTSVAFPVDILYASYQDGGVLPHYVKFALHRLSLLGHVTLLTNKRELLPSEMNFLKEHSISLFLTENRGFDFGMWRRYLLENPWTFKEHRLVVMNDSIVYYRDVFKEFFERAEACPEDAVSLTANNEVAPHLQSFFLYLKGYAVEVFRNHLLETPEQLDFYGAVQNLEIPFLAKLEAAGLKGKALFPTNGDAMFCYPELIKNGCGFVKRKLLQRRFNFMEQQHFAKFGATKALYANYAKLIANNGVDRQFDLESLPQPSKGLLRRVADRIAQWAFYVTYAVYFKCFKRLRDKLRGR